MIRHAAAANRPAPESRSPQSSPAATPTRRSDFWHALTDEPVADATTRRFTALLLYVDGKDDAADYAARVANAEVAEDAAEGFRRAGDRRRAPRDARGRDHAAARASGAG